jgi:hypothetical protein
MRSHIFSPRSALASRVDRRRRRRHTSTLSFPNSPAPPPSQPPMRTAAAGHAARTSQRQSTQSILEQQPPAAALLPRRRQLRRPAGAYQRRAPLLAHEAHWSMGGLSAPPSLGPDRGQHREAPPHRPPRRQGQGP